MSQSGLEDHHDQSIQNDPTIYRACPHSAQPLHRRCTGPRRRRLGMDMHPSNRTPVRICRVRAWRSHTLPIESPGQNSGRCGSSSACIVAGCARRSKRFPLGRQRGVPVSVRRPGRVRTPPGIGRCTKRSADRRSRQTRSDQRLHETARAADAGAIVHLPDTWRNGARTRFATFEGSRRRPHRAAS